MNKPPTRSTQLLTGLSTLLLVATVAFGLFLLVGAIVGHGPNGAEVGVHTRVDITQVDLPPRAIAPDDVEVIVRVPDATTEQIRWVAARDLAPGALVVAALLLLRSLLRSVRDGDPFNGTNVRRLRTLALVVLIGTPIAIFLSSLCASELASTAGFDSPGTELTMPAGALVGGLALFVLAEVFASGVRLRDDLEGTV